MRQLTPSKSYTQNEKDTLSRLRGELREHNATIYTAETMEREGKLSQSDCASVVEEMKRRIAEAMMEMKKVF